ncbi:hypothetical protein KIL84_010305 [Mauremys mutica]|uniref:HAT C-terminal dimerisation domain-containing protein n=1 Tax=Mauremys mutica TaxID=74926 RepID=A0A9D3XC02_9SAUR|nr:hypothetical protein KIL84_010305 [Mauremys mutica]
MDGAPGFIERLCDANPEIIVKVEPDDESAIGYPQGLSEGRIPGYPRPEVEENKTQQKESSTIEFAVSESSHPSEIAGCSQTSVSTPNLFERPSLRRLQPSWGNGDNSSINSSEDDDFEKELDEQERRRRVSVIHNCNEALFERNFRDDCEAMESIGRLKVKSVFEAIQSYPHRIQAACRIASSMPTTQASVERLFSALKLILNDLRQTMKDDLIAAIIFYRMNYE